MNNLITYDEIQYKGALKELFVILKYIPKADYEKIPDDILKMIEINLDYEYDFEIDKEKGIEDQKISEITKAMLENLYINYWVTEVEKNKIKQEEYIERQKTEQVKREKYNPYIIFQNKKDSIIDDNQVKMVEYKKSFLRKILEKLEEMCNKKKFTK